jgi:hypothetical protein
MSTLRITLDGAVVDGTPVWAAWIDVDPRMRGAILHRLLPNSGPRGFAYSNDEQIVGTIGGRGRRLLLPGIYGVEAIRRDGLLWSEATDLRCGLRTGGRGSSLDFAIRVHSDGRIEKASVTQIPKWFDIIEQLAGLDQPEDGQC